MLPTNKRNCKGPHRKDRPRSGAKVPGVSVQRRVPLPSRNYVLAGLESDAVLHLVYADTAETAFVDNTDAKLHQKVQAVF